MDKFSLYSYAQLSEVAKVNFNKALALGLTSMLDEIKNDDILSFSLLEEFVASLGQCPNFASVVEDLYSKVSSGIQVGSGNQKLFLGILSQYSACWEKLIEAYENTSDRS